MDTTSFVKLSDIEQRFLNVSTDFTNNRARITLTDSGNVISPRELRTPDFPLPCFCSSTGDTVHIVMGLGMKATMGIKIDLHDGRFNAIYFHEADDAKVFKRSKEDKEYTDRVYIHADNQQLTINRRKISAQEEMFTGSFEGQFKPFYQIEADSLLTRNYKAKLFFPLHSWQVVY